MSFSVRCPNCSKTLKVDTRLGGQTVCCPGCKKQFACPDAPARAKEVGVTDAPPPVGSKVPAAETPAAREPDEAVDSPVVPARERPVNSPATVPTPDVPAVVESSEPPASTESKVSDSLPLLMAINNLHDELRRMRKNLVFACVAVVIAVAVSTVVLYKSPAAQPQWEYMIASPSDTTFEAFMNVWGHDGWDLVSARRAVSSGGDASYEVILKRKLP